MEDKNVILEEESGTHPNAELFRVQRAGEGHVVGQSLDGLVVGVGVNVEGRDVVPQAAEDQANHHVLQNSVQVQEFSRFELQFNGYHLVRNIKV